MEMVKNASNPFVRLRAGLRQLGLFHLVLAAASGLLITDVAFALMLLRSSQALPATKSDIAVAQRAIRTSSTLIPREELQQELIHAETQVATAQAAIPTEFQPSRFVSKLLMRTEAMEVKLVRLQSLKVKTQTIGQHTYAVMPFVISLQGARPKLVTLLSYLEQDEDDTLVVRSAKLSPASEGDDLLLELDIYTRLAQQLKPQTSESEPQ